MQKKTPPPGFPEKQTTLENSVLKMFDQYINSFPLSIKEHIEGLEDKICKDIKIKYPKIPVTLYQQYFTRPHVQYLSSYKKFLHQVLNSEENYYRKFLAENMRQKFLNETLHLNLLDSYQLSKVSVEFATYTKQNNDMQSRSNDNNDYKSNVQNNDIKSVSAIYQNDQNKDQKNNNQNVKYAEKEFNFPPEMIQQVLELYKQPRFKANICHYDTKNKITQNNNNTNNTKTSEKSQKKI